VRGARHYASLINHPFLPCAGPLEYGSRVVQSVPEDHGFAGHTGREVCGLVR